MHKKVFGLYFLWMIIPFFTFADASITQPELLQRTQELFADVSAGKNTAWQKYFADDCLFFDEKGRSFDKAGLMKDVGPLPAGYQVSFKILNPQSRIFKDTAIHSYDLDEDLKVYGQQLGAKYHVTDTWFQRNGNWQIIASQVFRFYGDPKQADVDRTKFSDYVGKYQLAEGVVSTVSLDGKDLYYQRGEGDKQLLLPEAPQIFFRKGVEGRVLFHYGTDGKVDSLISRRNHEDIVWKKIS